VRNKVRYKVRYKVRDKVSCKIRIRVRIRVTLSASKPPSSFLLGDPSRPSSGPSSAQVFGESTLVNIFLEEDVEGLA
jgi:hypothetical protein